MFNSGITHAEGVIVQLVLSPHVSYNPALNPAECSLAGRVVTCSGPTLNMPRITGSFSLTVRPCLPSDARDSHLFLLLPPLDKHDAAKSLRGHDRDLCERDVEQAGACAGQQQRHAAHRTAAEQRPLCDHCCFAQVGAALGLGRAVPYAPLAAAAAAATALCSPVYATFELATGVVVTNLGPSQAVNTSFFLPLPGETTFVRYEVGARHAAARAPIS